jgi:hypothetical protein
MASQDLAKPDLIRNMRLIGYSDQGGRPDGVQLMVSNGFAYMGHMGAVTPMWIGAARGSENALTSGRGGGSPRPERFVS